MNVGLIGAQKIGYVLGMQTFDAGSTIEPDDRFSNPRPVFAPGSSVGVLLNLLVGLILHWTINAASLSAADNPIDHGNGGAVLISALEELKNAKVAQEQIAAIGKIHAFIRSWPPNYRGPQLHFQPVDMAQSPVEWSLDNQVEKVAYIWVADLNNGKKQFESFRISPMSKEVVLLMRMRHPYR